jgi:hypothetical protein
LSLSGAMPGLARKIVICAAVDGLVLQPLNSKKGERLSPVVGIAYGDGSVAPVPRDSVPDLSSPNSSFEAFGIVGSLPPCDPLPTSLQFLKQLT